MIQIREILKHKYENKASNRSIAKIVGVKSHNTVASIISKLAKAGLSWPLPDDLTNEQMEVIIYAANKKPELTATDRPQPDMEHIFRELGRKHVTRQLLWKEYIERCPDGVGRSQFNQLYLKWLRANHPEQRFPHKIADKMFVDWAGDKIKIVDVDFVEQDAHVFIAVLGYSSLIYAEACLDEKSNSWIQCHVNAFKEFGAVAEALVPDNLKTGVITPDRYAPLLNKVYRDMARHYNTTILPARVASPTHKSKVEVGVLIAYRDIYAALRNHIFRNLDDLNDAINTIVETINNRKLSRMTVSRRELFEEDEKPEMKPLPLTEYEYAVWKKATIGRDYHVQFDNNVYSAPLKFIGHKVDLRITASIIEVFHREERIASHRRSYKRMQRITLDEHRPKTHSSYIAAERESLLEKLSVAGPATVAVAEAILNRSVHQEDSFRQLMGIKSFIKRYGVDRVNTAATTVLQLNVLIMQP